MDDDFAVDIADFLPDEETMDSSEFEDFEIEYEDDGEYDSFEDLKAFNDEDVEDDELDG